MRRFAVLNVFLAFVAFVLYRQGLVLPLFEDDASRISLLILAWWAVGLYYSARGNWGRASAVADDLVFLGLIGTVVGFAAALTDVTPDRVAAGTSAEMVGTFVQGARTALYTTIVGSVGNYWLRLNYHVVGRA